MELWDQAADMFALHQEAAGRNRQQTENARFSHSQTVPLTLFTKRFNNHVDYFRNKVHEQSHFHSSYIQGVGKALFRWLPL